MVYLVSDSIPSHLKFLFWDHLQDATRTLLFIFSPVNKTWTSGSPRVKLRTHRHGQNAILIQLTLSWIRRMPGAWIPQKPIAEPTLDIQLEGSGNDLLIASIPVHDGSVWEYQNLCTTPCNPERDHPRVHALQTPSRAHNDFNGLLNTCEES